MGLGSGEQYESRFLRKCIDGGHAGIGHRRRVVGNQAFPRRVTKQGAGVEQETRLGGVRDEGITSLPRRRRLSAPIAGEWFAGRPSFSDAH
jgi:hypothetical protein